MNALFNAISARWTAMMAGRTLYNTEADSEAVFPYATVTLISDVADWTFTEDSEDCLVQFNLFSETTDCSEVGLTFEALKTAFDKYPLVVTGYTTVLLVRGPANLIRVDNKWQCIVTYRILIEKN